jgi:carboxymethylenebutenolidase
VRPELLPAGRRVGGDPEVHLVGALEVAAFELNFDRGTAPAAKREQEVEVGQRPGDDPVPVVAAALKAQVEALPSPGGMQDVQAAVDYAARAGKVAVMGYCWGGWLSWRAAEQVKGLAAAVPYYGGGMTTPVEAARVPACPVLAHFGEQDHAIPIDTVHAFAKAQPGVELQIYPAHHGFNCDHRAAYNAEAAALARQRTLAFLQQHVG